jgi:hypothetical protein
MEDQSQFLRKQIVIFLCDNNLGENNDSIDKFRQNTPKIIGSLNFKDGDDL